MTHENLKAAFVQGGETEATDLFNQVIRGCIRDAFWQMMPEEVESLCGKRYAPSPDCDYHRAGSESGSVYLDGEKEAVRRPRVRHETEGEVTLESYRAASSHRGIFDEVVGLVAEGMSHRGLERVSKGTVSKSAVSRMWAEKSREQLAHLGDARWMMCDGLPL
jgi:putative transposase